jgi:hypothetical protein
LVGFGGESHAELEDMRRAHTNAVETISDVHLDKLDGSVGRVGKDDVAKQARGRALPNCMASRGASFRPKKV